MGSGPGPGGRPQLQRAPTSDPGMENPRRRPSPETMAWDNPYGDLKRKNDLTEMLGCIDINAIPDAYEQAPPQGYANGQYDRAMSLGRQQPQMDGGYDRAMSLGRQPPPQPQMRGDYGPPPPPPQQQFPPRGQSAGYQAQDRGYDDQPAPPPASGMGLPGSLMPGAGRGNAYGSGPGGQQGAGAPPPRPPQPGAQQDQYNDQYEDDYGPSPQAQGNPPGPGQGHAKKDSVSDVYDSYFGDDDPNAAPAAGQGQRADSMTDNGPQAGQGYQNGGGNGYGQDQYGPPQGQGQGGYQDQYDDRQNFGPPQRSQTALPGQEFAPPPRSMTSMGDMRGQPQPQQGRTGSMSSLNSRGQPIGLPAHPAPYRPGLQQQARSSPGPGLMQKPPPVRNYAGSVASQEIPQQQQQYQQQQQQQRPTSNHIPPSAPGPGQQKTETPVTTVTEAEIHQLRITTNTNPNDQVSTLLLARKLILAADLLTPGMPNPKERIKTKEKWTLEAHKLLKKLVSMQNTDAMFYLADCYGRGALGLETSPAQAFSLYQSAAKAGHAAAAYRTAVCCEIGQDDGGGTRKDPLKAMQWYKRAATLGDTPAMYKMGMIMLKGLLGQRADEREAVMWLKRAAERADAENPHALHELALLYSAEKNEGERGGLLRDEAYALSLFHQAAELGYKFSQFKMGCAYEFGLYGVPISPKESIQWYSRAAVQEEHQSELALSGWYLTGAKDERGNTILAQSDTEAYLWARKAAVKGLAKAEYAMGYFMEMGIGSVRDLEGAKRWYWRAAAQNFPKARERLEELKRNGGRDNGGPRERISRSKVGKHSEGECSVM